MNHQTEALPGMAGPQQQTATVYLEVDGQPHPATDCHWIEIASCGCIAGISRAAMGGPEFGYPLAVDYTGEDAFHRDSPKVKREESRKHGMTYLLITNDQYRDTYMEQMSGTCPHTPKWGIDPIPVPDGWAWKTTDGTGDRRSYRKHLVPPGADDNDLHKAAAMCGKVASLWRWRGESHDLWDTVPCAKCEKRARATSPAIVDLPALAATGVVDVPTGGLL